MLAAQLSETGVTGLRVRHVDRPTLAPGDVLVRVSTVGVSQLDLNVIAGTGPGKAAQLPRILGIDPAGVIVEQGPAVEGDRLGERVVVKPNIPCGTCRFCALENEGDCTNQKIVGVHRDGGAAEFVAVPAHNVFAIGDLDFALATAAVHSVPIALHAINAAGGVQAGSRVLVTGATGSIGRAAVSLAQYFGAEVVAASRSAFSNGADSLGAHPRGADPAGAGATLLPVARIRYQGPDDLAAAVAAVAPDGIDLLIDGTGHAGVIGAAIGCLAWRGRATFCSASLEASLTIDARAFYLKRLSLFGCASADFEEVATALELVRTGVLTPRIASRHRLADIVDAYEAFGRGTGGGKVIVDVP